MNLVIDVGFIVSFNCSRPCNSNFYEIEIKNDKGIITRIEGVSIDETISIKKQIAERFLL